MEERLIKETYVLGFVMIGMPAIIAIMIGLLTYEDRDFLKTNYSFCITEKIESRKDLSMDKIKFICKAEAKEKLERKNAK